MLGKNELGWKLKLKLTLMVIFTHISAPAAVIITYRPCIWILEVIAGDTLNSSFGYILISAAA